MKTNSVSLSGGEKIALISNLSTMLSAGIPIMETVNSILEDAKGSQKKILQVLRDDLMQGKHVSDSFAQFPRAFDKVTINLLHASEEAGTLETTLKDLKGSIQKQIEFMDKVRFAFIYPTFIFGVFILVLLLMLVVVIPKIAAVFLRLKVDLPLPTRIMIFASDMLLKQTVWFVLGTAVLIGGCMLFYRHQRTLVLQILTSLPLVRNLVREIDLTNFSRSVYLLLSSGIPIVAALELAEDVVIRRETAKIIHTSREMVLSGKRLSEGFRLAKRTIPMIMIKLIEVGEKSGSLDTSMQDVSEYLEYKVGNTLKTVTAVIEPVMLLLVGLSVGGMMLSIIAPIYGLISQVGNR